MAERVLDKRESQGIIAQWFQEKFSFSQHRINMREGTSQEALDKLSRHTHPDIYMAEQDVINSAQPDPSSYWIRNMKLARAKDADTWKLIYEALISTMP